tara:strand:- start:492 stop:1346 length:855 start_codon:yes stop_codon:yes gene_type:complete
MSVTNQKQKDLWNGDTGDAWIEEQRFLDDFLGQLSLKAITSIAMQAQERSTLIDLGCGCGSTSFLFASKLANASSITGVDFSAQMIHKAQQDLKKSAYNNIDFDCKDLQEDMLDQNKYTHAFSRFGVMFFTDPIKAFTNIYKSMKENATLTFVCFQEAQKNKLQSIAMQTLSMYLDLPKPQPHAPSPFAFADQSYVNDVLSKSNFKKISCENIEETISIAQEKTKKEFVQVLLRANPTLPMLINKLEASKKEMCINDLENAYQSYKTSEGFSLPTAYKIVTALK